MKHLLTILLAFTLSYTFAQSPQQEAVKKTCLNYIEGFYEGDTVKLKNALSPQLLKFGYMKNKESSKYNSAGQMTFEQAIAYATRVNKSQRFAKPDAPKKVEVLDIMNHIASAKVTAWWGVDYLLLAKYDGVWLIEQVLWEGPLEKE